MIAGAVFLFPALTTADACCPLCHVAIVRHRLNGRGFSCVRPVVVDEAQQVADRRARLAHLRTRVLKVAPFGVDVDLVVAR